MVAVNNFGSEVVREFLPVSPSTGSGSIIYIITNFSGVVAVVGDSLVWGIGIQSDRNVFLIQESSVISVPFYWTS
jgi:hypothetical protein